MKTISLTLLVGSSFSLMVCSTNNFVLAGQRGFFLLGPIVDVLAAFKSAVEGILYPRFRILTIKSPSVHKYCLIYSSCGIYNYNKNDYFSRPWLKRRLPFQIDRTSLR